MIDLSDQDRLALRRWAIEQAIAAGFMTCEQPPYLVTAAQTIEAYALAGLFAPSCDVSSDSNQATPVQGQEVSLGHALLDVAADEFPRCGEAVPEQGVGDGFRAVAGDDIAHDEVSVGCDSATVGDGAGAVMAPAPDRKA